MCDAAQYLLLPTLLWVNGLALELMGSSDTGWRKSYGLRIRRDKLNNCVVVGGATTAEHKREQILFHMDTTNHQVCFHLPALVSAVCVFHCF